MINLPELAIRRHVSMLMLLVSLVVLGIVAVLRVPLAFLPEAQEPEIHVRLPYNSASPEQIERMVVRPVEDALGSLSGLESMWSRCDDEGGSIRLGFNWSTNLNLARVEVWEKLDRIRRDLPEDMGDITVGTSWDNREADDPILEGRLSSNLDLSESYDLLERKIIRPLERVPGVAQVRLDGVNPKEVRVNLRIADLELHRIGVREVSRILSSANFDQSLGHIEENEHRFALRTLGTFKSVEEIQALPLRSDGLRLSDVADVVYAEPPLEYGRHLDGDFAVGITVAAESSANSVEVCRALQDRIAEIDRDPELSGLNFLVWFNQGEEIEKTLRDLAFTGIFGSVLAAIVLFCFLRRLSPTIVVVACIPFSLIVTCGFIWAQGKSLNTLTLLGLIVGVGMLIDNAVVVMENIFRHQEMGKSPRQATLDGSREVTLAVTAATLTSVIVFLPLIFNQPSEMNIYLKELGITVSVTLLASLFISQTLIPMATSWFIRTKPRRHGRLMTRIETHYTRLLALNLRHRWLPVVVGVLLLASTAIPFRHIDMNFDTTESELFVQVGYNLSEEMTLDAKKAIVLQVEAALEPHREALHARSIYSWWSDYYSMTRVYLKEGEASEQNLRAVRARLNEVLPEIAGVQLEVMDNNHRFWQQDRGKRIAFQLVGEDSEVLAELAEEAKLRLAEIPGLSPPTSGSQEGGQEMHILLNPELVSRYDLTSTELAETVGLSFRGRRLPRYRTADGEREMRLTLDEQETESLSQLYNLPVWNPEGARVPLASVATFQTKQGAEQIQRDNRVTSIWVSAEYEDGTREEYVPVVTAALNAMSMPFGYGWTFGRWESRQQEKSKEFGVNLLLALLLVFAVMASLFESVSQAIALMVALPTAIAGAAWTLLATGTDFDQPAAVGLLLLIGIVVNNGIVMVEHINQYRRNGLERTEAMLRGGRERLRPILMTALTTLIGLTPMVIQRPSLGGVYYYSMALVIMGGLVLSTFLTSILLPSSVTLVEDAIAWSRRLLLQRPSRQSWRLKKV